MFYGAPFAAIVMQSELTFMDQLFTIMKVLTITITILFVLDGLMF